MKRLSSVLFSAVIILMGCSNAPQIKKEEALRLINKEFHYPKVLDYYIYCGDPQHAKKMLDAGLETKGLVIIQKTQKLKDIGNPLVQFTEKATPYLLNGSDEDKRLDIQKVKIADQEVMEIAIIKDSEKKNTVVVEYTTTYKNITPFSVLMKRDLNLLVKHNVYFSLSESGWLLQKPVR